MHGSADGHAKEKSERIGMKRFHVHVRVDDLDSSMRFYSTPFGRLLLRIQGATVNRSLDG
jgi:extradiol dioxygenase family protein